MRRCDLAAAGLLLLISGLGHAGVYNTLEPPVGPRPGKDRVSPLPLTQFLTGMDAVGLRVQEARQFPLFAADVAGLGSTPLGTGPLAAAVALQTSPQLPTSLRNYWRLAEQQKTGELSVADKVNLSYYLIYLGRPDEAVALLRELARDRQKDNFMVSANLGAAYLMSSDLRSAIDSTDQALHFLKRGWPGWSKEQVEWYRQMEKEQKKLIRLRLREASGAPGGRLKPPETVDDLFGVRFVGDDGTYQAGRIADAEKAQLPKDALAISQQLSLWYPGDPRLFWLVGEVLNAEGRWQEAKPILDQCSDSRGLNAVELRQHRQVLLEALQQANAPAPWLPDSRKLLLVGGGAGLIVVLLLYWQVREFLRRRLTRH